MAAANEIIKMAEKQGVGYDAFLLDRKKTRRGVITEWEDSIEELIDFVMPGQGDFKFERMRKKVTKDGKKVWTEGIAIMVTVKGDRFPTSIKIGEGHVALNVVPYIDPVKQCYRCFTYGHIQDSCKVVRKCFVCLEKEHGRCDKSPICLNCGGNHTSLSKTCWMHQRERAIRKVMAYKNVAYTYATAKNIVARQLGVNWENEDLGREGGSRDYPVLPLKKTDFWELKEVPLDDELYVLREAKNKSDAANMAVRRWENTLGNTRSSNLQNFGRGRGRGRLREEEKRIENSQPGARSINITLENRFEGLQEEEGASSLETPAVEEREFQFGNGYPMEKAIKKISLVEQRVHRKLIEQLEKQREENFLSDLMRLIVDKGYEQEVEKMLCENKKRNSPSIEDEDYDYWNTIRHRPNWSVPIPEKIQEKFRRRRERYEAQKAAKEAQQAEL
ncbi:uncharacterized protein LOC123987722 [Osmia bicornis bicornis]|uniref:uncharacterized protein LOC123987722 n=1 Tax=Osmia bicornis bicornis TaxID=1437191 RepID=UPI001EAE9855|nr:uncharacterized protein LOC123987722 [Osmia bicornis bicornis]